MALPIIFNLPRRRRRPQTEGGSGGGVGGGGGAAHTDKDGEGNQRGRGDGRDKKKNHTSKQSGGYKRQRQRSRADKEDAFIGGKRRVSPTYSDVLSVFSLNGLGYTCKSVCLSFMPFYFHSVDNKVSVSAARFKRLIRKTLTSQRKWRSRRKQTGRRRKKEARVEKKNNNKHPILRIDLYLHMCWFFSVCDFFIFFIFFLQQLSAALRA